MKNILQSAVLILSLLGLASCAGDGEDNGPDGDPGRGEMIRFEFGFGGGTRVATDAAFRSSWEPGDEIGIFITQGSDGLAQTGNYVNNMQAVFDGTTWNYTLPAGKEYFPVDGTALNFYAYYPYAGSVNPTGYIFEVKWDQSAPGDYSKSDALMAKAENVTKYDTPVTLEFSHVMSMVEVQVTRDINFPAFDETLLVTFTHPLIDAMLRWNRAPATWGTSTDITMHKVEGAGQTYRALVPPQYLYSGTMITFIQTTPGREISMKYEGIAQTRLTEGRVHKYRVNLGNGIDPEHTYSVGDYYPHDAPYAGVVYAVWEGGRHGRVVSLEQPFSLCPWADDDNRDAVVGTGDRADGLNNMRTLARYIADNGKTWANYPAMERVHQQNNYGESYDGTTAGRVWYLPSEDELAELLDAVQSYGWSNFNALLTAQGGSGIRSGYYWSSTEYGEGSDEGEIYVNSLSFGSGRSVKYSLFDACAITTF